jgi:hypothetical protein
VICLGFVNELPARALHVPCALISVSYVLHNLTIYRTNCLALHDRGVLATFDMCGMGLRFNFVMESVREADDVAKKIIFYQHPGNESASVRGLRAARRTGLFMRSAYEMRQSRLEQLCRNYLGSALQLLAY